MVYLSILMLSDAQSQHAYERNLTPHGYTPVEVNLIQYIKCFSLQLLFLYFFNTTLLYLVYIYIYTLILYTSHQHMTKNKVYYFVILCYPHGHKVRTIAVARDK